MLSRVESCPSCFTTGIHVVCPGKLLILVFYNEETPDDSLFHKSLDRLWRLGGAQAAIKEFADSRRFFSIKEKFNDEQVKQICYQLDVEFKVRLRVSTTIL